MCFELFRTHEHFTKNIYQRDFTPAGFNYKKIKISKKFLRIIILMSYILTSKKYLILQNVLAPKNLIVKIKKLIFSEIVKP